MRQMYRSNKATKVIFSSTDNIIYINMHDLNVNEKYKDL